MIQGDIIGLAAAVAGIMEVLRVALLKMPWFTMLQESTQSIIMLFLSVLLGVIGAFWTGLSIFPLASVELGFVMTGIVAAFVATFGHVILALGGIRANSIGAVRAPDASAQSAVPVKTVYLPWM